MGTTFQEWLSQGESIHQATLKEYHDLVAQLHDLETKLAAKKTEVNQIAQVLGKPAVDAPRRANNAAGSNGGVNGGSMIATPVIPQIVEDVERMQPQPSTANIARALNGKFGR